MSRFIVDAPAPATGGPWSVWKLSGRPTTGFDYGILADALAHAVYLLAAEDAKRVWIHDAAGDPIAQAWEEEEL